MGDNIITIGVSHRFYTSRKRLLEGSGTPIDTVNPMIVQ